MVEQMVTGYWLLVTGYWPETSNQKPATRNQDATIYTVSSIKCNPNNLNPKYYVQTAEKI